MVGSGRLFVTGGLNFHVNDTSHPAALKFLDLLDSFNFCQYINLPTHKDKHTLELIVTRSDDQIATDFSVYDSVISYRFALHCTGL